MRGNDNRIATFEVTPKARVWKIQSAQKILTNNFASFLRFRTKVFLFEETKHESDNIWSIC